MAPPDPVGLAGRPGLATTCDLRRRASRNGLANCRPVRDGHLVLVTVARLVLGARDVRECRVLVRPLVARQRGLRRRVLAGRALHGPVGRRVWVGPLAGLLVLVRGVLVAKAAVQVRAVRVVLGAVEQVLARRPVGSLWRRTADLVVAVAAVTGKVLSPTILTANLATGRKLWPGPACGRW